mmetsp:Transcript_7754/g.14727  ORF Transcript_7754/g.14727 Transcript_7754/m.14727 type:complete len:772 (-) Transcript_7754:1905-4220(-)
MSNKYLPGSDEVPERGNGRMSESYTDSDEGSGFGVEGIEPVITRSDEDDQIPHTGKDRTTHDRYGHRMLREQHQQGRESVKKGYDAVYRGVDSMPLSDSKLRKEHEADLAYRIKDHFKADIKESPWVMRFDRAKAEEYLSLDKPSLGDTFLTLLPKAHLEREERVMHASSCANIENLVCITMYNERHEEFDETIRGLYLNLKKGSVFMSENTLAVIIVDGTEKLTDPVQDHEDSFLKYLSEDLKLYHSDLGSQFKAMPRAHSKSDKEIEYCLAFEGHLGANEYSVFHEESEGALKVLLVIKEKNQMKLHSHMLFLLGLCPKFPYMKRMMFLDVGTHPKKGSVEKLLNALDNDKDMYGVCGHLVINRRYEIDELIVNFQKVDFILTQTLARGYESLFSCLQCLPGAYSAYKCDVLRQARSENNRTLIQTYLKLFTHYNNPTTWAERIVHLMSEDRVLVNEIYSMGKKAKYVPDAVASIDYIPDLSTLISQRKRWFTGTFFAMYHYSRITSQVSKWFLIFNTVAWAMSPAYFQIVLHLLIYVFKVSLCESDVISNLCNPAIYQLPLINIFVISVTCIIALISSADQVKWYWNVVCGYYCLVSCLLAYIFYRLSTAETDFFLFNWIWLPVIGIIAAHGLAILLSQDKWSLLALVHYFLILPTYINVIIVYSMCRTDDFSWGTRDYGEQIEVAFSKKKAEFLQWYVNLTTVIAIASVYLYTNLRESDDYKGAAEVIEIILVTIPAVQIWWMLVCSIISNCFMCSPKKDKPQSSMV